MSPVFATAVPAQTNASIKIVWRVTGKTATRRALNARDQFGQWPCERTGSHSAAHHLVHWMKGGSTYLANLILLCHPRHWIVHEGGWQLIRTADERLLAIPPPWKAGRPAP